MNLRKPLVDEAHRAVETNKTGAISWNYSEGPDRLGQLHEPWAKKIWCDCSAFIVYLFVWLGLKNPDGSVPPYYTGTELTHGEHIALILANGKRNRHIYAGMAVVYGAAPGEHTAIIVEVRKNGDILTVSMGHQGAPEYVWVNPPKGPSYGFPYDGRMPQTFLKFNTRTTRKMAKVVPKTDAEFVRGTIRKALQ
jgi:hypothetical protein